MFVACCLLFKIGVRCLLAVGCCCVLLYDACGCSLVVARWLLRCVVFVVYCVFVVCGVLLFDVCGCMVSCVVVC